MSEQEKKNISVTGTGIQVNPGTAPAPEKPAAPQPAPAEPVKTDPPKTVEEAKATITEEQKAELVKALQALKPEELAALKAKAKEEKTKQDAAANGGLIAPTPTSEMETPDEKENDDGLPWWAWTLIIAGAIGVGGALGYYIGSRNSSDDVEI